MLCKVYIVNTFKIGKTSFLSKLLLNFCLVTQPRILLILQTSAAFSVLNISLLIPADIIPSLTQNANSALSLQLPNLLFSFQTIQICLLKLIKKYYIDFLGAVAFPETLRNRQKIKWPYHNPRT